ncbi:PREDICTED: uncharacterized protein LOC104817836 [Tarenaya hassleriana]|uniref:uncharacterized protein LOC104817836 n=1 Tax=Tarenaya hassleriana TaxID=28532 RepID=UPI00053C3DBC|nr:PREDICTED: uncharacterized protein LOC104817836 [Tarenaya hassleriana]
MKVAAAAHGVMSVAIQGDSKDELVVVGDQVDAACLVATLRKKACYAILESLVEVKAPPPPPPADDKPKGGGDTKKAKDGGGDGNKAKESEGGNKNNAEKVNQPSCCAARCPSSYYHQPPYEVYNVVYDSYGPTTGCIIL